MRPDVFPAPRETDCAYGCCKAGDEGISSEVIRRAVPLEENDGRHRQPCSCYLCTGE